MPDHGAEKTADSFMLQVKQAPDYIPPDLLDQLWYTSSTIAPFLIRSSRSALQLLIANMTRPELAGSLAELEAT
jgi:hypothetical protein